MCFAVCQLSLQGEDGCRTIHFPLPALSFHLACGKVHAFCPFLKIENRFFQCLGVFSVIFRLFLHSGGKIFYTQGVYHGAFVALPAAKCTQKCGDMKKKCAVVLQFPQKVVPLPQSPRDLWVRAQAFHPAGLSKFFINIANLTNSGRHCVSSAVSLFCRGRSGTSDKKTRTTKSFL